MRVCSQCRAEDRVEFSGDDCTQRCSNQGPLLGHHAGCHAVHHWVSVHLEPLARYQETLTPLERHQGWELLIDRGKHYRRKYLCRTCINKREEVQGMKSYLKKKQDEAMSGGRMTAYQIWMS